MLRNDLQINIRKVGIASKHTAGGGPVSFALDVSALLMKPKRFAISAAY